MTLPTPESAAEALVEGPLRQYLGRVNGPYVAEILRTAFTAYARALLAETPERIEAMARAGCEVECHYNAWDTKQWGDGVKNKYRDSMRAVLRALYNLAGVE